MKADMETVGKILTANAREIAMRRLDLLYESNEYIMVAVFPGKKQVKIERSATPRSKEWNAKGYFYVSFNTIGLAKLPGMEGIRYADRTSRSSAEETKVSRSWDEVVEEAIDKCTEYTKNEIRDIVQKYRYFPVIT